MNLNRKLLLASIPVILSSCTSKRDHQESTYENDSNQRELTFEELYYGPLGMVLDTLSIVFYHENCGEWGGNQERLFITRDEQHRLTARLIADTVSCQEIIEVNETPILDDSKRIIIYDSTKFINIAEEELLNNMLCGIVKSYFDGKPGKYSEYYIKIENSFGSFYLEQWGIPDLSYLKARKKLFGKVYEKS